MNGEEKLYRALVVKCWLKIQLLGYPKHSELEDVTGGTLDTMRNSRAEAVAVKLTVFALSFGDAATTTEVSFDEAKVYDLAVGGVYERFDFRNGVEVISQEFLGGSAVDLEAV